MSDLKKFEHNLKFNQIIATAKKLFYRYGIKRVTIEEICSEAKVSKMTFYKFFPNKMELAKYLLLSIIETAEKEYEKIIDSDIPFPEKVRRMIDLKLQQTKDISSEFVMDLLKNPDPEIAELYQLKSRESLQNFMLFMQRAQQDGDIRADVKLEFILYFLNKMNEMSVDESLAALYETPGEMINEMINFFFYGILKR